jgi:hypothetical protein
MELTMKSLRSIRRSGALAALVLSLCLLAAPATAHAATRRLYVQKKFFQVTAGTSVSVTLHKRTVAGNLLIAYVVWDNAGAASVADTGGNTWASAAGPTAAPDGVNAQIFYAPGIAAGSDTVSATFAAPLTARGVLYVYEYSGLDRSAPLDAAVTAAGSGLTLDSGPLQTVATGELLFVGAHSNGRSVGRLTHGYKVRARKYGNANAELIAAAPGTYEVTAVNKGTVWSMQMAAFRPPFSATTSAAYPLKVSANGRYLVDQNDRPFLMTGDSPQALMVNLSESEADGFFADRQAGAFNLVWINLLCATYTGGRPDGSTYDGIVPFTTPGDLSTPNEAYFARVDDMLRLAANHGLVVLLDPAETGSFLSVLVDNGVAKARDYGRYLGTRYRSFDNIVWMHGNDFQTWPNAGDDAVVEAVAQGIHDTDDRHIHTVELDYQVSGSLDDPTWAPLIELNASYTYFPTYAQVLTDYDRANALPTFLVEANYEFEHNAADLGTPEILRRQAYWALLSGAAGQLYGNRYTWPFVAGWQSQLDTPGSQQMSYVRFLFEPRQWFNLIPDQSHGVVTAGYGTFADGGALGDNDYCTAARTPDGALVMAYLPTRRTITVDMTKLDSAANAQWYDPSNGTYTAIVGSPFANAGTRDFTPPGTNAAGDGDWVLVLEATSGPTDTTPPSVPTGLGATVVSSSEIDLAWTASHDDVAVAGYRVYRDGTLVHTTFATSVADTGLPPSTSYSYTVAAFDYASNPSAQSAPPVVADTPGPGPTFAQQAYATPQTPQSSVSATYAASEIAGDANILAIGWNDTTASIASVSDTAGNVYHPAVATFRGNGMSQAIWYAASIAGAAAGANHVTVTFDQPAMFVDLRITEYGGLAASAPFDVGTSATGNGSAAATGAISTGSAGELLFAAGMTGATFTAPGAGYASRVITAPDGDLVEDALGIAAGSHSAAASLSGGTWVLQLAGFRAGP